MDDPSVDEARNAYFRANGFTIAEYSARWVRVKLGPIKLGFPNTASRKAAVELHDLHHVATGYSTSWTGEAEIAAWELAAGCGRYVAAWVLNLGALAIGLVIAPRRVVRAFARGRRSRSLYHVHERGAGIDRLLALRIGELRRLLAIAHEPARKR